jgi:hypothetical protein
MPGTYFTTNYDGLGTTSAYQVSGQPFITGSDNLDAGHEHLIVFPNVTKSITVTNHTGDGLRVHFAATGSGDVVVGRHYAVLDANNESITMNVKCTELFISNGTENDNISYRVIAELTPIQIDEMYALTGSGITD